MPGPIFVVISGATVSSAFWLERAHLPISVVVPSHGALGVQLQFSTLSGTGPFYTMTRFDGTGLRYDIFSGTNGATAVVEFVPTPYARLIVSTATTGVATFTVLP